MKNIIPHEHRTAIRNMVEAHAVTRFLFSHVCMATCYGMFLFLYEVAFIREMIPVIHPALIGWAGIIVVYDVLICGDLTKLPAWKLLVLFAVASGISVITNMQAGLVGNIKGWVLSVLPIFAFLPVCYSVPKEDRLKRLLQVFLGPAIVVFLASLVSLVMYVLRIGGTVEFMGIESYIGLRLYDERYLDSGLILFGAYWDTNHAAMYAAGFAAYSLVLFAACRKGMFAGKWKNVLGMAFAVVNVVVQLCYFPLANSRGGWLCLCVASVLVFFLYFYYAKLENKRKLVKAAVAAVLAVAVTAAIYGVAIGARAGMTQLSTTVLSALEERPDTNPATGPSGEEPPVKDEVVPDEAWGDFTKQNTTVGAGRVALWINALKLYTNRPIFGECPGNNQYYATVYGYENSIAEGKALHNSYLDVLVDYGIVGFVFLMGFWCVCVWRVLRRIVKQGRTLGWEYYAICAVVLMTAGVAFLLSCTFVSTTAMYFLMLVMTGYLVYPDEAA